VNYSAFKRAVWKYYKEHGRHSLPWRRTRDPYRILVSEIMLQQTQVERVIPFYNKFTKRFPTARSLAQAEMKDVLALWQGLGYNRRAVNLKYACETIMKEYGGKFPAELAALMELPGIGPATAGDLLAFAFNLPAVVIETNIRTVFIHHFFPGKKQVSDKEIAKLVEETLDTENPRKWYYALMDYGAHLKREVGNNINRSKHYKKQSAFKGSNRELRSKILKLVLERNRSEAEIIRLLKTPAEPVRKNLLALRQEGLIKKSGSRYAA
jgi:A/G-specific adenine glycosylase